MSVPVIPDPWDYFAPWGHLVRVYDSVTGALLEHARVVDLAAGTVSFERFNPDLWPGPCYEIRVVRRQVRLELASVVPAEARAIYGLA